MEKKVKITISPLGDSAVEAIGFSGGACAVATKDIEKALAGGGAANKKLKPEYYTESGEQQEITQSW